MSSQADAITGQRPTVDVLNVPREAERLLEGERDPRRRAILENFRRHAMLEVAGRWPEILDPRLTVRHPVYRVSEGGETTVYDGRDAVSEFYGGMTDAGLNLLIPVWERMAVSDWGLTFESLLGQVVPGHLMHVFGEDVEDAGVVYLMTHRVANIWPYDEAALLLGENVYVDRASRQIRPMDPDEVITPEMAARALAPLLDGAPIAP
jgi:hypothetical protein